jgi:hypothetical protein
MNSTPSASAQDVPSPSATLVGLTTQEAEALLSKFGPNDPASTRRGLLAFELRHLFLNPLNSSHGERNFCLLLFDFQTRQWTELAQGSMGWLEWSKDRQYLQADDGSGTGAVIRIRLSDLKTERVVDLKNFATVGYYGCWFAVAPTIRRLCSATPEPRMFTPSTGRAVT